MFSTQPAHDRGHLPPCDSSRHHFSRPPSHHVPPSIALPHWVEAKSKCQVAPFLSPIRTAPPCLPSVSFSLLKSLALNTTEPSAFSLPLTGRLPPQPYKRHHCLECFPCYPFLHPAHLLGAPATFMSRAGGCSPSKFITSHFSLLPSRLLPVVRTAGIPSLCSCHPSEPPWPEPPGSLSSGELTRRRESESTVDRPTRNSLFP
jgi:hypothetical protein